MDIIIRVLIQDHYTCWRCTFRLYELLILFLQLAIKLVNMKTQKTNNKINSNFHIFYSKQQFLLKTTIHTV